MLKSKAFNLFRFQNNDMASETASLRKYRASSLFPKSLFGPKVHFLCNFYADYDL